MATFKSGLEKICALNNLLLSMTIGVLRKPIDQVSYSFFSWFIVLKRRCCTQGVFFFLPFAAALLLKLHAGEVLFMSSPVCFFSKVTILD